MVGAAVFSAISGLAALAAFYLSARSKPRLIRYGRPQGRRCVHVGQRSYDIEVAAFDDYRQALHHYFLIVPEIQESAPLLEVKYDFMDWTNALMRFEPFTVQLVREVDKIRLIKSHQPVSIARFEQDMQAQGGKLFYFSF